MITAAEAKKISSRFQEDIVLKTEKEIDGYIKRNAELGFMFTTLRLDASIAKQAITSLHQAGFEIEVLPFSKTTEEIIDVIWL